MQSIEKLSLMIIMNPEDEKVKERYDKSTKGGLIFFYYLDGVFGNATQNSKYRKKAISKLELIENSSILDLACGIGINFKILESYLHNNGNLTALDISPNSLKRAKKRATKNKWENITFVEESISDFEPNNKFDAILCTFAMEVIPDYKSAIDKIYSLLKEGGRFSMIGMKIGTKGWFNKIFSGFFKKLYKWGGASLDREVKSYVEETFGKIDYYEDCFHDYYYILSVSKGK